MPIGAINLSSSVLMLASRFQGRSREADSIPFVREGFIVSFGVDGQLADLSCVVTDEATLSRVAAWGRGDPIAVAGVVKSSSLGTTQLEACTFDDSAVVSKIADTTAADPGISQDEFGSFLHWYLDEYKRGDNEMQKTVVRATRDNEICRAFPKRQFYNWKGNIRLSGDDKANASVTIEFHHRWMPIHLFAQRVPASSRLYSLIFGLRNGAPVFVTGSFAQGRKGCIEEASFTENGAMTEPDFFVKLTDIAPAQ
jgi:hypothetical protein